MRLPKFSNTVFILVLSTGVSLVAALLIVLVSARHGLDATILTGDARGYMILAENIFEHRVFSVSREAPFAIESFRAPGYPFFLGILYLLSGSWLIVLIIQSLILSIAPALLYLLARPYNERAAFWGSIIFVFEPIRLFLGASLLSDGFFLCLLLGMLFLFVRAQKETDAKMRQYLYGTAGLALGVCILTRPIAMFLPLLGVLCILFVNRRLQNTLISIAVFLLATLVIVGPWMIRNHTYFGSYAISSVGNANLMLYNAPEYLKYRPSTQKQAILDSFRLEQDALPREDALSLARSSVFTQTFREIIRGEELSYLWFHLFKTIPFFLTDGLRDTIRLMGIEVGTVPNISTALLKGDIGTVFGYMKSGGLSVGLLLVGTGFWILTCALSGLTIVKLMFSRRFALALFVSGLVLYFAILTGPVSNARYRLPVEGFLIVTAMASIVRSKELRNL